MMNKDYNKVDAEVEVRLGHLEVATATIQRDVSYLRESIENHLATEVKDINKKLDVMGPKVEESHKWINRIQKYVVWPAVGTTVTAGILAVLHYWLGVI